VGLDRIVDEYDILWEKYSVGPELSPILQLRLRTLKSDIKAPHTTIFALFNDISIIKKKKGPTYYHRMSN